MMLAFGGWGLLCPEADELLVYAVPSSKYAGYGLLGAASDIGRGTLSAGGWGGLRGRVLRIPWCGRFIWPLLDAGLGFRYLVTPVEVRFGHPLRNPRRIDFWNVDNRGLQNG